MRSLRSQLLSVFIFCFVSFAFAEDCNDEQFQSSIASAPKKVVKPISSGPLEWWQKGVIYQIYPMSFKDSDGDGKGDLKGIESKVDHLKDIGVAAVWLSPIYSSPMVDFGYDISNYKEINKIFGSLQDLVDLKDKLHSKGIKLILDFVPNHSSDQHPWFLKSVDRIGKYTDYYVWKDPIFDEKKNRKPPNNWLSIFNSGSSWQWNEKRQQYYLHQFAPQQPDLNYNSPDLVEEMKEVLRFWMKQGVDGFRMDAVPYLFEDKEFRNEPFINGKIKDPKKYTSLVHLYSMDQPQTYDMIAQFRKVMDDFAHEHKTEPKVILSEAYTSLNYTMLYYGDAKNPGSHMPFNFLMINNCDRDSDAREFDENIHMWMDNMPDNKWANWVMGNHDNPRIATRYGSEMVDAINMLIMLLPGTAITYNGEEIGMEDGYIRWDETVDPQGLNVGPSEYKQYSRDGTRTPFQWDASTSAGFSTNKSTWLPVNPNFWRLNLEAQKAAKYSHYHVYKSLMALRNTKTIQTGEWATQVLSNSTLAVTRSLKNEDTYLLIINFGSHFEDVSLQNVKDVPEKMKLLIRSENSDMNNGDVLNTRESFQMWPKSGYVFTNNLFAEPYAAPQSSSASSLSSVLFSIVAFALLLQR